MRAVIIAFSVLFFYSCGEESCREDLELETDDVSIPVERLEKLIFQAESVEEMETVLKEYPAFSSLFLHADQYPNDSILAQRIYALTKDPSIDTLYNEAIAAFPDMDFLAERLEPAFAKLQKLYPGTRSPKIYTAVTGLYNDLTVSDSLIIVGIDFFIGEKATYKPMDIPEYILSRYDPDHLASIITKLIAGAFVTPGETGTLLSEMIDFGKTYYLTSRLLPCTADSILLGYTPGDMDAIYGNQAIIWANFVENEVLYETSHITKRKFLGERPNVFEISADCPGRIGAWVGWQIVESYMQNNDVTIRELLAEKDNNKIFTQSGYKPRNR